MIVMEEEPTSPGLQPMVHMAAIGKRWRKPEAMDGFIALQQTRA